MIRLGLWVLGRKTTEVNCHFLSFHIKGTCCRHDFFLLMLNMITWLRQCLSSFLFYTVTLFLPFLTVLFGRRSLGTAAPKAWALKPWLFEGQTVHAHFRDSSAGNVSLLLR